MNDNGSFKTEMPDPMAQAQDDLIVALDVPTLKRAREIVRELDGMTYRYKVGLEIIFAEGMYQTIHALESANREFMVDLKLNDTPNTIAGAMRTLAKLEVWGVTVMASTGPASLKAAVEHAGSVNVIGVTVLTSIEAEACKRIYGNTPLATTLALCEMLVEAGVRQVVCSPEEVGEIMKHDFGLIPICPGVRLPGQSTSGQVRVGTPRGTILAQGLGGHIVVDRAITDTEANGFSVREGAARVLADMIPAYRR